MKRKFRNLLIKLKLIEDQSWHRDLLINADKIIPIYSTDNCIKVVINDPDKIKKLIGSKASEITCTLQINTYINRVKK